jgi:hypothetical protein
MRNICLSALDIRDSIIALDNNATSLMKYQILRGLGSDFAGRSKPIV